MSLYMYLLWEVWQALNKEVLDALCPFHLHKSSLSLECVDPMSGYVPDLEHSGVLEVLCQLDVLHLSRWRRRRKGREGERKMEEDKRSRIRKEVLKMNNKTDKGRFNNNKETNKTVYVLTQNL